MELHDDEFYEIIRKIINQGNNLLHAKLRHKLAIVCIERRHCKFLFSFGSLS